MRIVAVIVLLWLVVGAFAAYQRGYFSGAGAADCAEFSTVLVTIAAGPLNYVGVNPSIVCTVPQPSS